MYIHSNAVESFKQKLPNTACTRTAGFAPFFGLFRGFGFAPFRGRVSSLQPPVTRAVGRLSEGAISLFCSTIPRAWQGIIVMLAVVLLTACGFVAPLPTVLATETPTLASGNSISTVQLPSQPTIHPYTETAVPTISTTIDSIRLYHNHIATRTIRDQYSFSIIVFDESNDYIPKSIEIVERESNTVIGQYELFDESEIQSLCSITYPDLEIYETSSIDYSNFPQGFIIRAYKGDFVFRVTVERLSGTREIIEITTPNQACYSAVQ